MKEDRQGQLLIINGMIRAKVRQIARAGRLGRSEAEDLAQDLWAAVLPRLGQHDPSRGTPEAFVAIIIDSASLSIARYRFAAKRNPRREAWSLDSGGPAGDPGALEQAIADSDAEWLSREQLRLDVAQLRADLPSDAHREVVDLLSRGLSEHAIGLAMGISRREAQRLLAEVREAIALKDLAP